MAEATLHDQIERVAKTLPVALAALYVAGFIIVAFRLARYGASSLELFRIQYVAAGFWFGMGSSSFLLLSAALRPVAGQYLFQTVKYPFKRKFLQGTKEIELAGSLTTNCFLVLLLVGISFINKEIRNRFVGESYQSPHIVEFALAFACIDVFLRVWLLFKSRQDEGVLWSYGVRLGVLFLSLLVIVSLFVSLGYIPTIPFSIGGGLKIHRSCFG